MSSPVIRIHVGAHKTATTYIQDTLALNQAACAAAGTAYWPRHLFRNSAASAIRSDRKQREEKNSLVRRISARSSPDPARQLRQFFPQDFNITISEENLLGGPRDAATGRAYYRAGDNLQVLKRALPDHRLEVFIALRSYSGFISSLYGEALRHGNHFDPDGFKAKHTISEGLWPRVLQIVQETFPKAKVIVWRYEDFARLEDELLERLSGLSSCNLQKLQQQDILPSASAEAIRMYAREAESMPRVERRLHMLALSHTYPRTGPQSKFSLFDEAETQALSEQYGRDIERIERSGQVEFLK